MEIANVVENGGVVDDTQYNSLGRGIPQTREKLNTTKSQRAKQTVDEDNKI